MTGLHGFCILNITFSRCCHYVIPGLHSSVINDNPFFGNRSSNVFTGLNIAIEPDTTCLCRSMHVAGICNNFAIYIYYGIFYRQIHIAACMNIVLAVRPVCIKLYQALLSGLCCHIAACINITQKTDRALSACSNNIVFCIHITIQYNIPFVAGLYHDILFGCDTSLCCFNIAICRFNNNTIP